MFGGVGGVTNAILLPRPDRYAWLYIGKTNRHYIDFKDSGIFISAQGLNFNLKLCSPHAISMM